MELSQNQIQIIQKVNRRIIRGDVLEISRRTGKTKRYVSMVLNPFSDTYNHSIVEEAVDIVTKRDQATKKLLQKI